MCVFAVLRRAFFGGGESLNYVTIPSFGFYDARNVIFCKGAFDLTFHSAKLDRRFFVVAVVIEFVIENNIPEVRDKFFENIAGQPCRKV